MQNTLQLTQIKAEALTRMTTGIKDFDSLLGGGFVNGEAILLAGQPGAGKSTILMQLATILSDQAYRVMYVSGEENKEQLRLRADRLNTVRSNIFCTEVVEINSLFKEIETVDPKFIIIDSIQMMEDNTVKGEHGSAKQTKHCLNALIAHAKKTGRVLIFIGHSTKTGLIAGLLTLQHMVDAVFFLSKEGNIRYIKANKNRFGNVDESFTTLMTEQGFREFTKQISKGPQLQVSTEYIKREWGEEATLSKTEIENKINSGFNRMLLNVLMRLIQKKFFGKEVGDYSITFTI
jgi:DNA repair protein RadA/Sms